LSRVLVFSRASLITFIPESTETDREWDKLKTGESEKHFQWNGGVGEQPQFLVGRSNQGWDKVISRESEKTTSASECDWLHQNPPRFS
jgi:hypothetical protein